MYERNAIVLERYFNQMFGYNMKNNIKTNFKDYCELVEYFEKYRFPIKLSFIFDEEIMFCANCSISFSISPFSV